MTRVDLRASFIRAGTTASVNSEYVDMPCQCSAGEDLRLVSHYTSSGTDDDE